jgi:hypothetical protein
MKAVLTDPQKARAALQQGDDPYGLKLKGERPEKILVINCGRRRSSTASTTRRMNHDTHAA